MRKPARDIEPEEITAILSRMHRKDITTTMNRVRSYLRRAFMVGCRACFDPVLQVEHKINFDLRHNPVTLVPRQANYERALNRHLSEQEILTVWNSLEDYTTSHTAQLFKLLFALGGQRPKEIIQASWDCYDFKEQLLILPGEITKNGREHTVPLNNLALGILHDQKMYSGHCEYPFPRRIGNGYVTDQHIRLDSLSRSTRRLIAGTGMEHFTPRDIRRTCKTLMGKIGISKDIRDRIHNHALNDVSSRHYDRYEYTNEKREALDSWNIALRAIIEPGSNIVVLPRKAL